MQENAPYTAPIISCANPNDWYIYFEYRHEGKWHTYKKREGINRIKCLKQRKKEAEGFRDARQGWLEDGWNPVLDPKFKQRRVSIVATQEDLKKMTFSQAMDFALEKKDIAKKTKLDYKNQLEHAKEAAISLGIDRVPIVQISRPYIIQILDKVQEQRKIGGHSYNKYRDTIRSMFTKLETWMVVDYNPATKIEGKRTVESNKYQTLDQEEKAAITEVLYTEHFKFYVFIQVLYHTGIRPKEILSLQIKDVDLKKQVITIVPDLQRENSKTKSIRNVPICDQLLPYLVALELDKYDPAYYMFGSPFLSGMGNRGAGSQKWTWKNGKKQRGGYGVNRSDYFTPSPNHISRDTVTKFWNKIVIVGLGIMKHLYALKHTGADDKILAGIDLDTLRDLYGHRCKYMTETYAKGIKQVYAKQIRDKSPAFSKSPNEGEQEAGEEKTEAKPACVVEGNWKMKAV